jgi:hypothetical protein
MGPAGMQRPFVPDAQSESSEHPLGMMPPLLLLPLKQLPAAGIVEQGPSPVR